MFQRFRGALASALIAAALTTPAHAQSNASAADSAVAGVEDVAPAAAAAATPGRSAAVSNPAISVIGWFQAVAGDDPALAADAFSLREAELGFQAPVDPFTRADFFLSAGPVPGK